MGWIKKLVKGIKKVRDRRDARKLQEGISKLGLVPAGSQAAAPSMLPINTMASAPVYQMGGVGIQQASLSNSNSGIVPVASSLPALNLQNQANKGLEQGGLLPFWRGAGGKLQFPWNDPRVPEFLQQFALDDSALKVFYRAPKGYVIVKDPSGRPYPILKEVAKRFGLWSPSAKPPISATDWKHYKRNQVIEKRLLKIARPALRKKRSAAPPTKRRGKC